MGACLVQMPPGLRKSGMPDSVLMPAPVKTTARRDRAIICLRRARSGSIPGLWQASAACASHRLARQRLVRSASACLEPAIMPVQPLVIVPSLLAADFGQLAAEV